MPTNSNLTFFTGFRTFIKRTAWSVSYLSLGLVILVATGSTANAQDQNGTPQQSITVAQWANKIWDYASRSKPHSTDKAFELLREIPATTNQTSINRMRESVARWTEHFQKIKETRTADLETARTELAAAVEKEDFRDAMRAAIEMQDLSDNPGQITQIPDVQEIVKHAVTLAHKAEKEGRVLEALDWFRRLDLLYDQQRTYYDDLLRVAERVSLLAFYAPERLHDLRNAYAVEQGEEPLPEYNHSGETWQDRIADITEHMILSALNEAHLRHIDGVSYKELADGGLQGIRTLLTTDDLVAAFPGMANERERISLLHYIDVQLDKINNAEKVTSGQFRRVLDDLVKQDRATVAIPKEVIFREFASGAMSRLDQFSTIIWPDEKPLFDRTLKGEFIGVGIQIELDKSRQLRVVAPLDGTPAQRAGIKRGDLIRMIDGKSTVGISLTQAVDEITGKKGTKVTLTIEREGEDELIPITITRDRIPLYTVKGWERTGSSETDWDYFVDPTNRIGYLRITGFSRDTEAEFDRAIDKMRSTGELNGLILDVRFDPGGLLSAATGIANRFVPRGILVSTADRNGKVDTWASPMRASLADLPVIVLVNAGSASASEIVSGCLQDHARALIVGERTYGKGTVQQVMYLDGGKAYLKLTMQQYLLPSGRSIHRSKDSKTWGVEPDVPVKMTSDQVVSLLDLRQEADITPIDQLDPDDPERPDPQRLLTEGRDPQLETALILLQAKVLAKQEGSTTIVLR